MNHIVIITAAILGSTAIMLGAFGAHAFKKLISDEKLASFEVGVRYQMYAAITLLIIGFNLSFDLYSERFAFYGITLGTLLFSVSIYFLSFAQHWNKNLKFLGPITPLGGLLMIAGWVALIIRFI
jgi:uncharacterized membrane protein YgdD (TMEM256/DUF423 family)